MFVFLIILAILATGLSWLFVSEVTMGVWVLGIGVLLAIFARIAQAEESNMAERERFKQLLEAIKHPDGKSEEQAVREKFQV
ncbi:MAG: hypothetical protein ACOC8X_03580 [Chloroflexota bacterium]